MKVFSLKPVIAAVAMLGASTIAEAQEVTLTMSHFLSPKAPPHAKFLEPWAKKIEADSGGRIKVEIFPSMTLGGKPPELYRQLRDGAADIVWTLAGYTPGVFPRSEVFELPTVHLGSAEATTLAIQDTFDQIAADYADVKPLLIHVNAGNAIHMVEGCIDGLADLKGKKLRTPSRTGSWMLEAWGAEPVGMPVPDIPQALSKGVIDGAMLPFEIMPAFKIHELTKCSITGAHNGRFGTSVFIFAMNKERYDSLPDDLKAVIDANSGAAIAPMAGALWDEIEGPGEALQKESGSPVKELDQAATDEIAAASSQAVTRWIEEAKGNGIAAEELVSAARAAIAAHTK